jgi:hypothetical protein
MALRDCHGYNGIISVERAEAFMSTESSSKTEITSSNNPERARRLAWLGPPPLFKGEDAAAYEELSARTDGAVRPADIFEEIWARDFINNEWDVLRYRRHLASLMTSTAYEGLQKILEPLRASNLVQSNLARSWASGDKAAIKRVDELLASAGLTMDAVMAQTFCTYLDECERIGRMIASAEARRDDALHEIELHRARWGQELRRVTQEVEKSLEMEVIEDKSGKTRTAA